VSAENLDVTRRLFDCFNANDLAGVEAIASPSTEIVPLRAAIENTAYRGRDAPARLWADAFEAWEELTAELESVNEAGDDCILVTGRLRGRGRESGVEVDVRVSWAFALTTNTD
jgi:ketosteroid isomerase-like protein